MSCVETLGLDMSIPSSPNLRQWTRTIYASPTRDDSHIVDRETCTPAASRTIRVLRDAPRDRVAKDPDELLFLIALRPRVLGQTNPRASTDPIRSKPQTHALSQHSYQLNLCVNAKSSPQWFLGTTKPKAQLICRRNSAMNEACRSVVAEDASDLESRPTQDQ